MALFVPCFIGLLIQEVVLLIRTTISASYTSLYTVYVSIGYQLLM